MAKILGINYQKDHDLNKLWENFVEVIAWHYDQDVFDDTFNVGHRCVQEIENFDKNSYSFRYSADKRNRIVEFPLAGLDLVNLHDVMNGIQNFFECISMDMHHRRNRCDVEY